jgi:glycosyltransferase involved in cell wall biosynthesis
MANGVAAAATAQRSAAQSTPVKPTAAPQHGDSKPAAMKVLLLAPLVAPIVDRAVELTGDQIGGAQTYLADLAGHLAQRGHRVTLLAAPGSAVGGVETVELPIGHLGLRAASFDPPTERTDLGAQTEAFALARAWLDAHPDRFDLVHAHAFDAPAFTALRGLAGPVVHTLHLPPVDPGVVAAARSVADEATLTTNSETNAAAWRRAGVPVREIVPNGLDVAAIPFGEAGRGYLLFAGRLTSEKGPDLAIAAAAAVGRPLVLVGGVYDRDFYERAVRTRVRQLPSWRPGDPLAEGATYVGARSRADVFALMAGADALLMPVRWDEPLGLVAMEAPAAGCPVVAFARGGLAEVVVDGVTGWLAPPDDLDAFVAALGRLGELDRRRCRADIASRYGADAMVRGHEELYRRAAATGRTEPRGRGAGSGG